MRIETHDSQYFFQADVACGFLTPDQLSVEIYADTTHPKCACIEAMNASALRAEMPGAFTYTGQVSATRPASDYTVRIIPRHPNASVPLEAERIIWQR